MPAILTDNRRELEEWLVRLKEIGKFERVQIDFVDGEYANNLTVRPSDVDLLPYLPMLFDAHLMVTEKNISVWSGEAVKVGFDRIIAQMESISQPENFRGLAMDVHSPVEAIEPYLPKLEAVVVMAVEPGFSGQEFVNLAVDHLKRLTEYRKKYDLKYKICVDGGVDDIHLPFLEKWGADEVAVGVRRVLEWQ